MRIPLDYYRILGLPIQATPEQLQQAYRDRSMQLPRREFSELAIAARRELIDEAYAVLSEPSRRQAYDAQFLAKSYELLDAESVDANEGAIAFAAEPEPDPYSPDITIQDEQFVGALLILQELGEYELVLKLGRPYIDGGDPSLRQGRFGDPDIVVADFVLTVALACLELGREQWQQGQYENAAESLQVGQDLLLREGLFASLRGEMQADLYKLRPYRILELVALPDQQPTLRRQGIELLEDMLHDRGGMDGTGNDQSGLGVDDFLRFIHQLRSYLTASEQQTLFEAEARRPSAVAIYLAIYALVARGFAERQPALIRRAKSMLLRLGTRQDVHLEQAVCSLLLGQTEEASRALELSREAESLHFIRTHSQDSPDLLPGLCLYSERWLQNEVFPHFRDLAYQQASLKDYFADEGVQSYLEELPTEPEVTMSRYTPQPIAEMRGRPTTRTQTLDRSTKRSTTNLDSVSSATATLDAPEDDAANLVTAERVSASNGDEGYYGDDSTPPTGRSAKRQRRSGSSSEGGSRRTARSHLRIDRLLLLGAIALGTVLLLGFLFNQLFGQRSPQLTTTSPVPESTTPGGSDSPANPSAISDASGLQALAPVLNQLVSPPGATALSADEPLTEATATQIIQAWLAAKAAATGEGYQVEQLETILTDPALSDWQSQVEQLEADQSYRTYEHTNVSVTAVEISEDQPDEAVIEAAVTEQSDFYRAGQLEASDSYNSTLQIRYTLIRQDDQWRIQSWEVQ